MNRNLRVNAALSALGCLILITGCAAGGRPTAAPGSPTTTPTISSGAAGGATTVVPATGSSPAPGATSSGRAATPPAPTSTADSRPVDSKPVDSNTLAAAGVVQRNPGWALDRIDQRRRPLDKLYHGKTQGAGVTVYVVDGMFDTTNAEFGGRARVGLRLGKPCVLEDGINHGMFVAGLAAGRYTGVARKSKIVLVGSSYGCEGAGEVSAAKATKRIVRAVNWVADNARPPAVVNLSLNTDGNQPTLTAAIKRLTDAKLTVVVSAGNQGENACKHPPAGLPSVITVTGSTKSDRDAGLNYGRCVDLYAPAAGVRSVVDPQLNPHRVAISDRAATSWAAPIVSGVAAGYLSAHPTATPKQVRRWLIDNASTGVIGGNSHGTPNRLLYSRGPI